MRGRTGVAVALVLGLPGASAFSCDTGQPVARPLPPATARPLTPATARPLPPPAARPQPLTGVELRGPTGLRLLVPGWVLDVDARVNQPIGVTGWLVRPGAAPLLLDEAWQPDTFGSVRVSGSPVVHVGGPALTTVAASADGNGLWVAEYHSQTACVLREVGFDGRDRRPARAVPCGTRPRFESAGGLWCDVGPDAFVAATTSVELTSVLLDPATLAERGRFGRVEPVDEHRVVVLGDPIQIRDPRAGVEISVPRPPAYGWPQPRVGSLSPDRRWLPFTFGEPGTAPQAMDVWLLDLRTSAWVHLPSMPAYAALKGTDLAWAADGRLVLLGDFSTSGKKLVTWRPGDPALSLLPYERPPAPDTRFLVR